MQRICHHYVQSYSSCRIKAHPLEEAVFVLMKSQFEATYNILFIKYLDYHGLNARTLNALMSDMLQPLLENCQVNDR